MGGDSILSIQIVGKALQKGIEITVSQMFENQTIAEMADCIADIKESYSEDQIEEPETGEVLLTPIQKWFLSKIWKIIIIGINLCYWKHEQV